MSGSSILEKGLSTNDDYNLSILKISFDYIANFIKAHYIDKSKYKYLLDLPAYKGLLLTKSYLKHKEYLLYESLYEEYLSYIMEYVYSEAECIENIFGKTSNQIEMNAYKNFVHNCASYDYKFKLDKEKLIKYSIFFAKLESIYDNNNIDEEISYITCAENKLVDELIQKCDEFKEEYIKLNKK